MIERRIVRRYASALFSAASKAGVIDRVESDLGLITYAMESMPNLMDAVSSPVVPGNKKKDVLQSIFADKVHEITLSYMFLLVDKRREEAILQTEEEYIDLANESRGIVAVKVTTAIRLSEDEETRLTQKLSNITGSKHIHLEKRVDPNILGGVIVRIKDRVIDGSIKGYLETLKEKLLS